MGLFECFSRRKIEKKILREEDNNLRGNPDKRLPIEFARL